jgi:thiol-disulfide isomerase/thioredoxin
MLSNKNLMIISGLVVVIIIFIGGYYLYNTYVVNSTETFSNNQIGSGNKDAKLMFFYANWCPHCRDAKPEWNKIKDYYKTNSVNGYNINCIEYDCTEPSPEVESVMDQYNVDSYPTIILETNNMTKQLSVKPTQHTITNFVNENLS